MNVTQIKRLVKHCLVEDMGSGDITTNSIVPEGATTIAVIHTKETGVISGLAVAEMVFRLLAPNISAFCGEGKGW